MWKQAVVILGLLGWLFLSPAHGKGVLKDPDLPKKYTSKHFVIYTPQSKKFAKQICRSLEIFRKSFLKGFGSSKCFGKPLKILPPEVFIFSNKKDYQAFCSANKKQFVNREAFFDWSWDAGFDKVKSRWNWRLIGFVHKKYDDMQKYLIHELTHIFLNYYLDKIPLWLDEGIAVYMQTVKIRRGRLKQGALAYGFVREYQQALRMRKQISLAELLAMTSEDDAKFTSLHYAESWALVHLLLSNRRSVRYFRAFLKSCAKGGNYQKNFKKYFRLSTPRLQKQLEKYVKRLKSKKR